MEGTIVVLPNELTLVARARVEPAAFATVYDHYFPRVYNYVRYRINDAATADDLTAQVFERILARIEQLRSMVASGGECTATAVKAARLGVLRTYYVHKIEMMNGWEKDVQKRKEYLEIMTGWIDAIDRFRAMVETARVAASGGGPG